MRAALLAEYHRPLELVERPEPEPARPRDVVVRVGGRRRLRHRSPRDRRADGAGGPAAAARARTRERGLGARGRGRRHGGRGRRRRARLSRPSAADSAFRAVAATTCTATRHEFTGLTRDGGFADFVLVDERSLVPIPSGVDPVDGRALRRRGAHGDARGQEARPPSRPRYDRGRDRRRRRRAHRTPAGEGSRRLGGRRHRHRRTASGARPGARRGRGRRRPGGRRVRRAGAHGRRGGRGRDRLRGLPTDARVSPGDAARAEACIRSSASAASSRCRPSRSSAARRLHRGQSRRQLDRPLGGPPAPRRGDR